MLGAWCFGVLRTPALVDFRRGIGSITIKIIFLDSAQYICGFI